MQNVVSDKCNLMFGIVTGIGNVMLVLTPIGNLMLTAFTGIDDLMLIVVSGTGNLM